MADALFSTLQRFQGAAPWGSVLDAGTGDHSLRWLLSCNPRRLDASTGAAARQRSMAARFAPELRPQDRLIAGNWTDPLLLHGEVYDQVLADYLLGAIDGFAPYFQDRLFARLRPHVGQRLYVVGLAPYPEPGDDPGGQLIWEIARLRDAAILLLAEPWTAWDATAGPPDATRLARRFLRRHPDRDRADPDEGPLSDRAEAADYHAEEEALENGLRPDWPL